MRLFTRHYKKIRFTYIFSAVLTIIVSAFFLPSFDKIEYTGNNYFSVYLNDTFVGTVSDPDIVTDAIRVARLKIAKASDTMVLMEAEVTVDGRDVLVGKTDSNKTILANVTAVLTASAKLTLNRSYTVKINEFTVNLRSSKEIQELLQACIDKYDTDYPYTVSLIQNPNRELNVLSPQVLPVEEVKEEKKTLSTSAGIETFLDEKLSDVEAASDVDFDEYYYGILDIDYSDTIEIVEAYLPEDEITSLPDAIETVTKDQEKEELYEVISGDTLSGIAMKTNLTIDQIIAMNENIESENSTIRVGDMIVITVPQPELSVAWSEEVYYEEDYEAPIQYVLNDDWYTTSEVVLQEPSAGYRKVVAIVDYQDQKEINRTLVKDELVREAIPKIVEKGTKIPPTYIKPISGGHISSPFGARTSPRRGASSYHEGVDWATPVGTSCVAASSGTVAKAGWSSGYGYVIYINHIDGKQTRYAHLSKIYVSAGQYVTQGQKIALTGNTGVSTGAHLHFEIRINGTPVNPISILN